MIKQYLPNKAKVVLFIGLKKFANFWRCYEETTSSRVSTAEETIGTWGRHHRFCPLAPDPVRVGSRRRRVGFRLVVIVEREKHRQDLRRGLDPVLPSAEEVEACL
jgi:hypothetical protein